MHYNIVMNKLRTTVYYEFFTVDQLEVPTNSGTSVLSDLVLKTGIDSVPTLSLTIPLENFPTDELDNVASGKYLEPRMQRYIIVVHIHREGIEKYVFRGVIDEMEIDYANYNVTLHLSHQVSRMREWAMPLNYTIKNMPLDFAIGENGSALGYSQPREGFTMQSYQSTVNFEFIGFDSGMPRLNMTFGANNKLEALSEVLDNTESCHFWVKIDNSKVPTIVIQNYDTPLDNSDISGQVTFSPYRFEEDDCDEPDDPTQVTMLTEPTFNVDYTNHYNRAVVLCGDIQDGVHHLTLETIYNNPSLQVTGFPIKMYSYDLDLQPEPEYNENGRKINNEKIYSDYEVIAYTTNTNREYYIEDTEQLQRDDNIILNTTFNFNELYPLPSLEEDLDDDGTMEELVITDKDRTDTTYQAYIRAIRRLKMQRPERVYQFNSTALPVGTNISSIVKLAYSKSVNQENEECDGEYQKRKILNINENMYLTELTITFDAAMNETCTVTLDKVIRPHDISPLEIELTAKASSSDNSNNTSSGTILNSSFDESRSRDTFPRIDGDVPDIRIGR